MGFKPLNEKFVKMNQSLGRIQRLYQDALESTIGIYSPLHNLQK
jgi:hypothetical protein